MVTLHSALSALDVGSMTKHYTNRHSLLFTLLFRAKTLGLWDIHRSFMLRT